MGWETFYGDELREECGIFGVYNHPEAANLTYLGLYALQHRGQESAGIVSSDGKRLHSEIAMGLVADIFDEERLSRLKGNMAIGHNRYSTCGSSQLKNAQPIVLTYAGGTIAVAHNGNLVNARGLRRELDESGAVFRSDSDSEAIVQLIAKSKASSLVGRINDALSRVVGAYSLLFMTEGEMVGVRDVYGFRPLCIGRLDGATIFASETCALDLIGAEYVREVKPGEIVVISESGASSVQMFSPAKPQHCIFEFIYFSRPDSIIFGKSVNAVRKEFGRQLAREMHSDADIVIPVPDSGAVAALGYSEESGIPFENGLIRNHYVGRTFIEPRQSIRHFGVKIKLNPVKEVLVDKRVIVIDDSIVRGTTSRKIVEMIRNAGAKEIHMKISSPPIRYPCFYGIDTPTRAELIASTKELREIEEFLTVDSLQYLSLEGMLKAAYPNEDHYCRACFTGVYATETPLLSSPQLLLFEE